jgi:site-specific DNA-methyltransferase (adenine-specific)
LATVTKIEYTGIIFCPTVSTGAFIARRNGKIFITGNSGFPKSLNIGKAVDKMLGNEREEVLNINADGRNRGAEPSRGVCHNPTNYNPTPIRNKYKSKGSTKYEGYGTALKPALEPITLARKPISEKSIAENVLKWNTGGINIDGCRVGIDKSNETDNRINGNKPNELHGKSENKFFLKLDGKEATLINPTGRFPSNFIHDGSDEVLELFPSVKSGGKLISDKANPNGLFKFGGQVQNDLQSSSGSASRFFYVAKASKSERNLGLEGFEEHQIVTFATANGTSGKPSSISEGRNTSYKNNHPTVKPVKLMQYLVRLVTPVNGVVLDPFAGSGTTGIACKKEGFQFIGIELDKEYYLIADARIKAVV